MDIDCSSLNPCTFAELVSDFLYIISLIIPLIFSLTLLVVVWKVIDAWILHGGDTSKVAEGKQTVLIGIIALVVMSSVWGIIALLRSSIFV